MRLSDLARFEISVETANFGYRTPMKFGGRVVHDATLLTAKCFAETRGGALATGAKVGVGAMTMGVAWAWPHATLSDAVKLDVLVTITTRLAEALSRDQPNGHPLDVCKIIEHLRADLALKVATEFQLEEPIPPLAVLLAASPIESALFDAQGKALGVSSYALLGPDHVNSDLSGDLGLEYQGKYLSDFISTKPATSMPLYHLVGALDPLDDDELSMKVGDGLPETLAQWIVRDGLSHLKIKLAGDAFDWDVKRVLGVHRVATTTGNKTQSWAYSLDFNERCDSADYVLALVDEIERRSPTALSAIQYIEQPTHRDLAKHPENVMHAVAKRLPVVIDESLVDLASLRLAVQQGYSGVALKACKGHREALLMAAVARHDRLFLCVQDLTCIGASLLHSASLAAHIPGVAAIESNGRQYCPAGNADWNSHFPGMFDVQGGVLPTSCLNGPGLGY